MGVLTFLGTGGAFTDFRENYHNNAIVNVGERQWVLIDCGGTAVQSLKELNIKPWEIVAVIVTHLHGDHVGGIEQLAWERYYTGSHGFPGLLQTKLICAADVLPGVRDTLTPCVNEMTTMEGTVTGGFSILFDTQVWKASERVTIGTMIFSLERTPHVEGPGVSKASYGVWMADVGDQGSAYFTSDTIFRADIGDLFPDVDFYFHDCTFGPKYPGTVHTHYEDLQTLPLSVRTRTVLMHYTKVPEGKAIWPDNFFGAARRHETFAF